ncbi:putative proteasome endopeptidase complex [Rosa chinensis]|uniref:Putative proteasome endopeptidase complex n=1 Tax=Rosa chinensis TaxID=74649 RepID=A0A2P6PNJ6_ROSCH|nr:putative proteasome endopeptidase complex [Rosa chinensis]
MPKRVRNPAIILAQILISLLLKFAIKYQGIEPRKEIKKNSPKACLSRPPSLYIHHSKHSFSLLELGKQNGSGNSRRFELARPTGQPKAQRQRQEGEEVRAGGGARVGRKQRKQKGPEAAARLPTVTPLTKCKLRLLKLERIKDYLLMEEKFVTNQERLKPEEEKAKEDRSKVDDLRASPMSVGNLEELIDENHAIVSSSVEPEYYVGVLSFVDKDQLEPGCAILMHNKSLNLGVDESILCLY